MIDLSILQRSAIGHDLEVVSLTKEALRAIVTEISDGRWARAQLRQQTRTEAALVDLSGTTGIGRQRA